MKVENFYMLSKLTYQLKIECHKTFYLSLMVATKEQCIVDIHKIMIKVSKLTTTKSNQITKTAKEKERDKSTIKQCKNNEKINNIKSLPINNYYKCELNYPIKRQNG